MSNFRTASICLNDFNDLVKKLIEENHSSITVSPKNGKTYLNIAIRDLNQPTQSGSDLVISANQKKEAREAGESQATIGWGTVYKPR
jgi:hypothetical protein